MSYEAEQPRVSVNENEEKAIPDQNDHKASARTLPQRHSNGVAGYMKGAAVMSPEQTRRGCEAMAPALAGCVMAGVGAAATGPDIMRNAIREAERPATLVGADGPPRSKRSVIDANGIEATKPKSSAGAGTATTLQICEIDAAFARARESNAGWRVRS